MTAPFTLPPTATAQPLDDIRTFMPSIGVAEYDLRAKLRSLRNVASALIGKTESPTARQLAWIASDWTNEIIFAPADLTLLAEVGKFCGRLMVTAMHAERLETEGRLS
jgi:hypothetical protein